MFAFVLGIIIAVVIFVFAPDRADVAIRMLLLTYLLAWAIAILKADYDRRHAARRRPPQ